MNKINQTLSAAKRKILVEVSHGALVPHWYGLAWHSYERDAGVFAPIPFNWIMALGRWSYYTIRFGSKQIVYDARAAYGQGYYAGLKQARESRQRRIGA